MATLEPYITVVIPWSATPTIWHPTTKTGPLSTLTRGMFATTLDAVTWARKHLKGQPFTLAIVDDAGLRPITACTCTQHAEGHDHAFDCALAVPEITTFALQGNGTHARGFALDGARVLVNGESDAAIAAITTELAGARQRCAELQAEVNRVIKLNTEMAEAIPPKRPAQLLGDGVVRFDPVTGQPWLLNTREKGWSAWGVVCADWDDLFRRFNVRVTGHGVDAHGAWWQVTPIAAKEG